MPETTYGNRASRIFISYSRKDSSEFVKRLAADLRYVLNNTDAVWYDTLMSADKEWLAEITRQLSSRKVFIFIASPNALKSPWVKDELQQAWIGKNQQTSAKKTFIVIHFRECMNQIPKELNFLRLPQWIQCFPPKTYQSVLSELFGTADIPLNHRAIEFLRTLDTLNLADLVRPKASTDFSNEERKEHLNMLGKYVYVCIRQDRWENVEICADEALQLAPNDLYWQTIKQKATEEQNLIHRSRQKTHVPPNGDRNARNSTTGSANSHQTSPTTTKASQSTKHTSSSNTKRSTTENTSRHQPPLKTSNLSGTSTIYMDDSSQPLILEGNLHNLNSARKSIQDGVKNFIEFMRRLAHRRFILVMGLINVFLVPIILGIRTQPYLIPVFLVALFSAFILTRLCTMFHQ